MSIIARFHDGSITMATDIGAQVVLVAMLDSTEEKKLIVDIQGTAHLYDVLTETLTPLVLPPFISMGRFFDSIKYFIKIDDLYIMHINDSSYALSSLDAITWEIMAGYPIQT